MTKLKTEQEMQDLFMRGVGDYLSFMKAFESVEKGEQNYEDFVKVFGGYNRGLGYTDYNYKNITVTICDGDKSLCPEFEIWDGVDNYEADIQDWI